MAASKIAVLDPIACCTPVRADVLDEAQAELLAASFAALADPIRLRLLSYIAASDADEVCACDLTRAVRAFAADGQSSHEDPRGCRPDRA